MQVNPDVGSMDAVLDKLYGKVGTNKSYISRIEKGALEPHCLLRWCVCVLG